MREHSTDPYPEPLTSATGHAARAHEAATTAYPLPSITSPQTIPGPTPPNVVAIGVERSAMEQAVERPGSHAGYPTAPTLTSGGGRAL